MRRLLLALLFGFFLQGCGSRGNLYIPTPEQQREAAEREQKLKEREQREQEEARRPAASRTQSPQSPAGTAPAPPGTTPSPAAAVQPRTGAPATPTAPAESHP